MSDEQLRVAVREVNEQRAFVKKLQEDVEASQAAVMAARRKLEAAERAEAAAYLVFSGRQAAVDEFAREELRERAIESANAAIKAFEKQERYYRKATRRWSPDEDIAELEDQARTYCTLAEINPDAMVEDDGDPNLVWKVWAEKLFELRCALMALGVVVP